MCWVKLLRLLMVVKLKHDRLAVCRPILILGSIKIPKFVDTHMFCSDSSNVLMKSLK